MLSCLILWLMNFQTHTWRHALMILSAGAGQQRPWLGASVCVSVQQDFVSVCETECQRRQASCLVESECASYNLGRGVATPQMFWMFLPLLCFWFLLVCLELEGLQAVHCGTFQGGLTNSPWCPFCKTWRGRVPRSSLKLEGHNDQGRFLAFWHEQHWMIIKWWK